MGGGGKTGMHSPEGRAKIAEAMRTRIVSAETRAKMAAAKRGRIVSQAERDNLSRVFKGRIVSKEAGEKISKAKKGKRFTAAHRAALSAAWDKGHTPDKGMGTGKYEKYKGQWFRSSYEVRFAKALDRLDSAWDYEPERFFLGAVTYLPDFWIAGWQSYVEVKGFLRDKDVVQFGLFREQVNRPLILIMRPDLEALETLVQSKENYDGRGYMDSV